MEKINFHNTCHVPCSCWVWATAQTHHFRIPAKGTKIETIIKLINKQCLYCAQLSISIIFGLFILT